MSFPRREPAGLTERIDVASQAESKMCSTMWRRARANRSGLLFLAVGVLAAAVPRAEAAQLSVDAPESCLDPSALADEVGDLIGKPLGSVADVDFRIQISETPQRRWRLRLEMIDQRPGGDGTPAIRGSREIEGATCAELAEAASVAIAVSVRSISLETAAPEPSRLATPEVTPPPTARELASLAHPARATPSWHPAVALAFATDTGALPNAGLGVDLEGDFQRGSLRLIALATWFGSQDILGVGDAGGTFQLALGGTLACYAPRWGRWTTLACGGFELGRLAGTGLRVARPETGDVFWRAARADLGVTAALGGNIALLLRAGMAVPQSHPAFVLDGSELVYRPGRLAGRLTAGLELGF
jgi:hypothetical protein